MAALRQHHLQVSGCEADRLGDTLDADSFDVVLFPSDIQRSHVAEVHAKSTASAIVCLEDFTCPPDFVEFLMLAKRAG
jgi:hypothetical protein